MLRDIARTHRSIVFAAALIALPAIASAAEIKFNVPTGDYNTATNWEGGVLPGNADAAVINNGGSVTISAAPAADPFELWVGSDTLGPASAVGQTGNLTMTGGNFNVIAWAVIGRTAANLGGLPTGSSTFNITGGTFSADQIEMGQNFGAGVSNSVANLNISGSSVVTARNYLRVGHGDFGSYGGTGNVVVKDNAILNVGGGAAQDFVALGFNGFNQGNKGTMLIQDNAHVNLKMPLRIGWVEEGHGELTKSGNTLLDIDSGEGSFAAFMLGDFNNGANTSPNNRPVGVFTQSGGVTNVGHTDRRPFWSAIGGSGKGTLNLSGGSFNAWIIDGLNVADTDQNGNPGEGTVNLSGTGALNATELWFGKIGRGVGTMNQTGGSVTVGLGAFIDRVALTAGGAPGTNPEDNALVLGGLNIGAAATEAASTGNYNLSAGTVNVAKLIVGNAAKGNWNQTGGDVTVVESLSIARVINDYGIASVGVLNLGGGTITTPNVIGGAGNSTLNLNGGVLKASANNATFISGVTSIVAGAGGAKINSNGFDVATAQQITGAGSLTKQGGGSLALSAAIAHTGGTNIELGSLKLSGAAQTSVLSATGDVDIKGGRLVLDYTSSASPQTAVVALLTAGYGQPTKFSAGKIKSSTATGAKGLGWVNDTATSTLTVAVALYGDTDINGTVNFDDLLTLAQNYGITGTGTWAKGDSTYDTNVNFDDLLKLAQNYGGSIALDGHSIIDSGATAESFAADFALALSMVPEPTSAMALLAFGGIARRQRRN